MTAPLRILAVDDDPGALGLLTSVLAGDHEVTACGDGSAALAELGRAPWDLVFADLTMPPPDGFDVLRAAQRLCPPPVVVVVTALDTARATMEALRLGARDYLVKPADPADIRAAAARVALALGCEGDPNEERYGLIGESAAIRAVRRLIPLLSRSNESALVLGETGTGKELVARALHEHGPRRAGPFVAHNMAATPGELAESLFFGHARGAFSGATHDHAGLFEQAHGGTLFLDEVDSFPLAMQAKLLRVLETGRVQRVGSGVELRTDARVIAASSADLGALVARSAFRADLYYRLRQLEVTLCPLRARREDIPLLARRFLSEVPSPSGVVRLSDGALDSLMSHAWPGNCRELRNTLRSAALLSGAGVIMPSHLPYGLAGGVGGELGDAGGAHSLEVVERDHILRTLESTRGNRSHAARLLGIDRGTLARKLQGIPAPSPQRDAARRLVPRPRRSDPETSN